MRGVADRQTRIQQPRERVWRPRRLLSVQWEITYRCNEVCDHCYLNVLPPSARPAGELTTQECLDVIDQLAANGVLFLTLSGGEVLIRSDFIQIAGYARRKGFALTIYTNGTLINPRLADLIASLYPLRVELSLYGAKADTHDLMTGRRRSLELTSRACRLLVERGVRVLMKALLMHENVQEFQGMKRLAEDLGAGFIYDITITPKDGGGLSPLRHRLTEEDLLWLFRETLNEAAVLMWKQKLATKFKPNHQFCNISRNSLLIDPYGEVYPCVQTRLSAGNLRTGPLREIWLKSPVWHRVGSLTLESLPICSTCDLKQYCTRCHGLAMVEQGELHDCASICKREARVRRRVLREKGVC